LVYAKTLKIPRVRLQEPTTNIGHMSSRDDNANLYKPLPKGITVKIPKDVKLLSNFLIKIKI